MSTDAKERPSSQPDTAIDSLLEETPSGRTGGSPLAVVFPPDPDVWIESRRLVGDKNLRVDDLATCSSQDPVVVMDLLRTANAMYFSSGKSAISTARTAIVRLGSDVIIDILEKMKTRPVFENEDVRHWFELHRSRCRRSAIVARILSEALARTLCDDCQTAALFLHVGEMLAVAYFREEYVKLAEDLSRSGIVYRLAQEQKFNTEEMGLMYLRRQGIPEVIIAAIDREARVRTPERAIMKPLCLAAAEMVEAFDMNRWEKIAPGKKLPPKSALRMLQFSENQYLKVYERCSEYLFSARQLEERRKQQPVSKISDYTAEAADSIPSDIAAEQSSLQLEIRNLLKDFAATPGEERHIEEQQTTPQSNVPPPAETRPITYEPSLDKQFELDAARSHAKTEARDTERPIEVPKPAAISSNGQKLLDDFTNMFAEAKNSEELLTQLLKKLVDEGPFEKSALIVVSKDRSRALVVAARGPNIGNGQMVSIDDPLSPLAQCFSKVQSFGNRESPHSPFGSKSFALAPLDADHQTPVALYADCGNEGAVPFEARRIFRMVVDLVNQKLPQLAGSIPVEI